MRFDINNNNIKFMKNNRLKFEVIDLSEVKGGLTPQPVLPSGCGGSNGNCTLYSGCGGSNGNCAGGVGCSGNNGNCYVFVPAPTDPPQKKGDLETPTP